MKDIPGFEGKYAATQDGQIWSYHSNRFLKPNANGTGGYKRVYVGKNVTVHRLIALTFVPNPHKLRDVHHINHDRTDNRVENLMWTTHKKNVHYTMLAGRHKNSRTKKLSADQRYEIMDLRRQGWSTPKLAKKFGVCQATMYQFVSGQSYILDYD